MFCENCGKEVPGNAKFCSHCGNQIKKSHNVTENRNMILALFLSIFLAGLGLCYADEKKKGIIIFVSILIFRYLRYVHVIFHIAAVIIWVYAIYETYKSVKIANGNENPNLTEDMKNLLNSENIFYILTIGILVVVCIFFSKNTVLLKNTDNLLSKQVRLAKFHL